MSRVPAKGLAVASLKLGGALAAFVLLVGAFVYFLVPKGAVRPAPATVPSTISTPVAAAAKIDVRIGELAPDFAGPLLRNPPGELRLSDVRGKAVVMNFWASWCGPCRAEARDLEATYQRYKAKDLVFLGVDIDQDTWEDAMAFVKEFGITYPMVRDTTGKITERYQIANLPTTYFIDRRGVIRDKYIGGFLGDQGKRALMQRIEALLR